MSDESRPAMNHPHAFQRLIQRLSASPSGSALLARTLNRLDRLVARLTGGRHTATRTLAGVPVLTVETIGARSGRRHPVTLLAIPRGPEYVLLASAFGNRHHPAWYHNLLAHTLVDVTIDQVTRRFRARVATGAERELCWQQAIAVYPGYAGYQQRAGRLIPVVLLTPESSPRPGEGAAAGSIQMTQPSARQDEGGLK
jgi:deazaflavin-dependent oxidoreductase (nitroreductase family)